MLVYGGAEENWAGGRSPCAGTAGLLVNVLTGGRLKLKLVLVDEGLVLGDCGTLGLGLGRGVA